MCNERMRTGHRHQRLPETRPLHAVRCSGRCSGLCGLGPGSRGWRRECRSLVLLDLAGPGGAIAQALGFLANPTQWHNGIVPAFSGPPRADEIIRTALDMAQTLPPPHRRFRASSFMAGHGVQTTPLGVERDAQTCFVAGDFEPGASTFGLIPCDDLRRELLATGFFSEAIMFLDCCRSPMVLTRPTPPLGMADCRSTGCAVWGWPGHKAQPEGLRDAGRSTDQPRSLFEGVAGGTSASPQRGERADAERPRNLRIQRD